MKGLCAGACLTIVIMSSLFSHAADANADAQFKAIYEKEWAWRQAQRGEEDDDGAPAHRKVKAQLPKVDPRRKRPSCNTGRMYCSSSTAFLFRRFRPQSRSTTLCIGRRSRSW